MQYNTKCVKNRYYNFKEYDKLPINLSNALPNCIGDYRRYGTKATKELENTLLDLYDDKAINCTLCSSGMQAFKVLLDTVGKEASKIIVSDKCYLGVKLILESFYEQYKIKFVDFSNLRNLDNELTASSLVLSDSVNCMTLNDFNLKEIISKVHKYNSKICVDNTVLSSYYYNPFKDGADYVIESLTKYAGGHGDVMAGVLLGYNNEQYNFLNGITLDPFSCYLLQRGISTLPLRLDRITYTTKKNT